MCVGGRKYVVQGLGPCGGCGQLVAKVRSPVTGHVNLLNVEMGSDPFEAHQCEWHGAVEGEPQQEGGGQ